MPWLRLVVILTWTSFHRVGLALLFPSQIVFFWQFGYVTKLDATHLLNEDIANDKTKSYIDISKQSLTHRAVRRNSTTICVWMHPWRGIVLGWQVLQNTVNCEIFCTDNDFYILYMKDRELGPECVGIFTELYLIINYSKSAWRIWFIEMFIARICRIIKLSVAGWDDINLQCLCQQMCLHIRYGTFFTLKP